MLAQALKSICSQYGIRNSHGTIVASARTLAKAQALKRRFEIDERPNPRTGYKTTYTIEKEV